MTREENFEIDADRMNFLIFALKVEQRLIITIETEIAKLGLFSFELDNL